MAAPEVLFALLQTSSGQGKPHSFLKNVILQKCVTATGPGEGRTDLSQPQTGTCECAATLPSNHNLPSSTCATYTAAWSRTGTGEICIRWLQRGVLASTRTEQVTVIYELPCTT